MVLICFQYLNPLNLLNCNDGTPQKSNETVLKLYGCLINVFHVSVRFDLNNESICMLFSSVSKELITQFSIRELNCNVGMT